MFAHINMVSDLLHLHVIRRLKIIHLSGIAVMLGFFFLLWTLGEYSGAKTLPAELILLCMALLAALSYATLLARPSADPPIPLFILFLLNACASGLVWATGILQSPFILLYIIFIIITSQLYRYGYGLAQTILAIAGFVGVYSATVEGILPYYPLLPGSNLSLLFQSPFVIVIYGLLYAILFLFTVLSSSSARTMLYRPMKKVEWDTTFQEKIIQEMPLGIIIADSDLQVLGNNPTAAEQFPVKIPGALEDVLTGYGKNLRNVLQTLSRTHEEKTVSWKLDTGETRPVTISARLIPNGKGGKNDTYVLFLQ